jgi:hypothetical protein
MENTRRKTTVKEWTLAVGFVVIGVVTLALHFSSPEPSEADLITVSGIPSAVERSSVPQRHGKPPVEIAEFTIGDVRTSYASENPNGPEVLRLIKSGANLTCRVITRRFLLGERTDLYGVESRGRVIVSPSAVMAKNEGQSSVAFYVGLFFAGFGIVALILCWRHHK